MDAEVIRTSLRCDRHSCPCQRPRGNTHCPTHADEHPSLTVEEKDGRVLVRCRAGCKQGDVLAGLRARGLWPERPVPILRCRARGTREVRYEIRDADGQLVAIHLRCGDGESKQFWWERPDGRRGLAGQRVEDLPLFGVNHLRDRPGEPIIVTEGEKAAEALFAAGRLALGTVTGAAGTPSAEILRPLIGWAVILWPDNDDAGRAHMARIGSALRGLGVETRILDWAEAPPKGDAADFVQGRGAREALDALLATAVPFEAPKAHETSALLEDVAGLIHSYVVMGAHQVMACALWTLHSWAIGAADTTPYIRIESPERESGKTRLEETLSTVTPRAWYTGRTTVAALIRKIAAGCTLLLDETDRAFQTGEEYSAALLAVLNTGYRRGGIASVCVGQGAQIEVRDFPTFGPKVFAGLGRLPDTVASRSIPIRLRRRTKTEPVQRFYWREAEAIAAPLRRRLEAWAAWAVPRLRDARSSLPEELGDRTAECWESLFTIADLAGGDCPRRAREAALILHRATDPQDETSGIALLAAIRNVFADEGTDRVTTTELLRALVDRDDGPWSEWWGKAVATGDTRGPGYRLARLLRSFDIRPRDIRTLEGTRKGFLLADFEDAFVRYLPSPPGERRDEATMQARPAFQPSPHASDEGSEKARSDGQEPHGERLVASSRRLAPGKREAIAIPLPPLSSEDLPPDDGELATPEDLAKGGGAGQFVLRVGEATGWRPYTYRPGHSIAAGKAAWLTFIRTHSEAEVLRAAEAMLADPALNRGAHDD